MKYYLDCEFDGYRGSLLSLALVREDGESIYLINDIEPMDLWVRANVQQVMYMCPKAPFESYHQEELAGYVAGFLMDDPDPVIISDWPADIRYFCDLIEFPMGEMAKIAGLRFEMHRVDAYPTTLPGVVQHNAWWDAMALRHLLESQ